MTQFQAVDTAIIVAMVLAYIAFTSWLTIRLRSKTVDQFMTAARALPPAVIETTDCEGLKGSALWSYFGFRARPA